MLSLINAALSRVRTVLLFFVLIMITGFIALVTIPKEASPDITIPYVYVGTGLEGISPEDADRLLIRPLEQELRSVEGLKEIVSTASEGRATLTLEFLIGVDIDAALREVRDAVDTAKNNLPAEADDPTVSEINLAMFPIINVSLYGSVDERILFRVAEDLKDRLEGIPGVLEAPINGKRDEVAEIIIDPALMASYNISQEQLVQLVNRNNQLVTAGNIDTGAGRFAVKVPGLIETEEDILNLPVKVSGDTVVRFRDIAVGQRTYMDAIDLSRVNGQPAVTLEVTKRVGENIISTIDEVKAQVASVQPSWPLGIEVVYTQDNSVMINQQLDDLFNSVLLATLLVFIVIVWALGFRSAFLVGIAIPASFLTGMLVLQMLGITLNIVVLFALILCVGMLVDGAIVITEYADRRMSEGSSRKNAYREAANRMAWPIAASTATTLAVFMPLLFWPGIAGEFMGFLPKTVIITLTASLVVALIVVPSFGTLFGKAARVSEAKRATMDAIDHGDLSQLKGGLGLYIRLLKPMLHRPALALLLIGVIIAVIIAAFSMRNTNVEFFPDVDADFGSLVVRARGNLSLLERDALVRQVEQELLELDGIKTITTRVTAVPLRDYAEDTIGVLMLEFVDWQLRPPSSEVMNQALARASQIPGIVVESQQAQMGPTTGIDVQLQFLSDDLNALYEAVDWAVTDIRADERTRDVSDNRPLDGLEWQINVDREAASRFGVDLATVGSSIQMITSGLQVGSYRPLDAEDELEIRIRYPFDGRDLDQIDRLTVTSNGQQVPLSNFITRSAQNKQGDIFRTNGRLTLDVDINLREGERVDLFIESLNQRLEQAYQDGQMPEQVAVRFVGDQQEQAETMAFLAQAFGVAFFIMIIILVTQFNSFFQTALILTAVGLSTIGVLVGIIITGSSFGVIMSGVGIIALAGIVVNNNIVLIDTFNQIRRQGVPAIEAAMITCAQRLRPVLLTTITTILGLVPMVYQLTIDLFDRQLFVGAPSSQWWTQLSTTIAGGLLFATVLTLIFTPCMLMVGERLRRRSAPKVVESYEVT
ncbi:MAG: efflux RND transporter permease subunit [Saccharospirillum sp.]